MQAFYDQLNEMTPISRVTGQRSQWLNSANSTLARPSVTSSFKKIKVVHMTSPKRNIAALVILKVRQLELNNHLSRNSTGCLLSIPGTSASIHPTLEALMRGRSTNMHWWRMFFRKTRAMIGTATISRPTHNLACVI